MTNDELTRAVSETVKRINDATDLALKRRLSAHLEALLREQETRAHHVSLSGGDKFSWFPYIPLPNTWDTGPAPDPITCIGKQC